MPTKKLRFLLNKLIQISNKKTLMSRKTLLLLLQKAKKAPKEMEKPIRLCITYHMEKAMSHMSKAVLSLQTTFRKTFCRYSSNTGVIVRKMESFTRQKSPANA